MVDGKGPCSISEQGTAFKDGRSTNKALKGFTARQASFSCNGGKMGTGLVAERKVTLAFASPVGADGHEGKKDRLPPHNSLPPHHRNPSTD